MVITFKVKTWSWTRIWIKVKDRILIHINQKPGPVEAHNRALDKIHRYHIKSGESSQKDTDKSPHILYHIKNLDKLGKNIGCKLNRTVGTGSTAVSQKC